jgi:hypothetical protein
MGYIGSERKRQSPYRQQLVEAKCVQLLANYASFMHVFDSEELESDDPRMQSLLADVESVRTEYAASPDDIQWALEANDPQMIIPKLHE